MGSLVAALASYLDIRTRDGVWCVRIDDIDPPRAEAGATDAILAALARHGLHSDEPIRYQSQGEARYAAAFQYLEPRLFWCTCTRKSLRGLARYPGTCRDQTEPIADAAIRLRADDAPSGDFILRRRDELWAYNFATAVDDGHDFDRILRGADLEHVAAPQKIVMQALQLEIPEYIHIPVLCHPDGAKLSKQTGAPGLDSTRPLDNLRTAFGYLGQQIESVRRVGSPAEFLAKAQASWRQEAIPDALPVYAASDAR